MRERVLLGSAAALAVLLMLLVIPVRHAGVVQAAGAVRL